MQLKKANAAGVHDIIIDPGFGFSKSIEQNFYLLKNLHILEQLGKPILAGLSRKSMLYKLLDITPVEALNATTAANMVALMHGAAILRVHDVKEAVECIKLYNQIA
ncbi:MAG TPA: dihydropteroate synthase [Chitinophagales bacterium]|nr:dihydropteroate synthase [Chitinophagales bacterium]